MHSAKLLSYATRNKWNVSGGAWCVHELYWMVRDGELTPEYLQCYFLILSHTLQSQWIVITVHNLNEQFVVYIELHAILWNTAVFSLLL